ncbi:MAG: alanine--tRNA ligase [Syntrophomonadaceae bacterium]|nr:alanine--tRNA ligase [Syntrophomonadaceae bacterium]
MWSSSEIRKTFLDFFKDNGHSVVESSSLVPVNDPTLLFTNAGMNQFKDVFLGIDKRNYVRATTSQKCVRAGGKHNDLDTVGRTPRHHTFFEMLGNFSFGDYFKPDAIKYAWEFLTVVVKLPKENLWITVFQDDDEASDLWQEITGIDAGRIVRLGEKDNFWSMGDTGPCGPCSEILYDRGVQYSCGHPECGIGICDCSRWLEIWNLVFMQFNRDEQGVMTPLPRPSIDTGMGLERLTSILQEVTSNFDTDLFIPIIKQIEDLTGIQYDRGEAGFPFRVIADHSRACTFLIADGVLPSNEGRGYVLRRILRRALRFGRLLGVDKAFLFKSVDVVSDLMKQAYPELEEKREFIKEVIKMEEERFLLTLNEGIKKVEEIIKDARVEGKNIIPGEAAFMLYDTYGFPLDLTEDMAEENRFTVDKETFSRCMEEQRQRARQANKGEDFFAQDRLLSDLLSGFKNTVFTGYDKTADTSQILALIKNGALLDEAADEEDVLLITANTPFYAESGGQLADAGTIKTDQGTMEVQEVKKLAAWVVHKGIVKGKLRIKDKVDLAVETNTRLDTARNHTATHLLHKALREVLGEHAQQKGSLVGPNRLRFDFSHLSAVSDEELSRVEQIVNQAIWKMYQVGTIVTGLEEAREIGATALFGEKYGEEVRIVKVEDFSMELCGGTHVQNTGQIGLFKILSEGSVGSGLRRIEAVTGRQAWEYFYQLENELKQAAFALRTTPLEISMKIEILNRSLKEKEKELDNLKARVSKVSSEDLISQAYSYKDAQVLIAAVEIEDPGVLRQNAEMLRDKLGSGVVLLASITGENKVSLACFISKDLVARGLNAGKLVNAAAQIAGGGGGGRPDMAQAGAKDVSKLGEALEEARNMLEKTLA